MSLYYQLKKGQEGNKEATKDIYLQFYPNIKKLSKNLNYEEGETDLTIAFLELIKTINLSKLPTDDKSLIKFIYKSLKNKSTDLFRKNVVNRQDLLYLNLDILCDKEFNFNSNIFVSHLLSSLPPMQRTVLVRKFIQQYTDREISQILKISRQAVNKLKNRGLKNLRKILNEWRDEEIGRKNN